jgi:hypothetical protein
MSRSALIGLTIGLWLGFVWVIRDFDDMILVGLAGLIGYLTARILANDLDLGPLATRIGLRR